MSKWIRILFVVKEEKIKEKSFVHQRILLYQQEEKQQFTRCPFIHLMMMLLFSKRKMFLILFFIANLIGTLNVLAFTLFLSLSLSLSLLKNRTTEMGTKSKFTDANFRYNVVRLVNNSAV